MAKRYLDEYSGGILPEAIVYPQPFVFTKDGSISSNYDFISEDRGKLLMDYINNLISFNPKSKTKVVSRKKFKEGGKEDNTYITYEDLVKNPNMIYTSYDVKPYLQKGVVEELNNYPELKEYYINDINKGLADGSYIVNRGTLPEVVITPTKQDKKVLRTLKRILPYKSLRDSFYEWDNNIENPKISQAERILKLNKLVNDVNYPTPHEPNVFTDNKLMSYIYKVPSRAFTNINANDFYNIDDFKEYVAELSHALQYKGKHRFGLDTMSPISSDFEFFDDKGTYGGKLNVFTGKRSLKTPFRRSTGYDRPGHYEYNAHKIIEPAIWDYLRDDKNGEVYDYIKRNLDTKSKYSKFIYRDNRIKEYENPIDELIGFIGIGDRKFDVDKNGNAIFKNTFKSGGTIYIKPENRGKFNATKERTGKTTEELTHSKNPLTRKRAIFAQNAAKWKH